jgi:hypothetical protein
MSASPTTHTDEAVDLTLRALDAAFGPDAASTVNVRLWNGSYWPDDEPRVATIVL